MSSVTTFCFLLLVLFVAIADAMWFGGGKGSTTKITTSKPRSQLSTDAINAVSTRFSTMKNNKAPTVPELERKFDIIAAGFGQDEEKAVEVVKIFPYVLFADDTRLSDNLDLLNTSWGPEKAKQVILRNPNILSVATKGYGSLEASLAKGNGNDIVAASYVVGFTRPAGPLLLSLLFLALAKAAIFGV